MTKKTISSEEWKAKLVGANISKSDINDLVMNYLVVEGYQSAASHFSREANVKSIDLSSIHERMKIREAVQNGMIEEAIDRVNDFDPEILDKDSKLLFHLQQQHLIELLRVGKIQEALEFAQEELAPKGEDNPEFLEELEKTMSLFAFPISSADNPVSTLLEPAHRLQTACELNSAILTSQCSDAEPKLLSLMKLLLWGQDKLSEKLNFPKMEKTDSGSYELR